MPSFFWKFTRSGHTSSNYVSLIIDVHNSNIDNTPNSRKIWNTSFSALLNVLVLLQDVELVNERQGNRGGVNKPSYVRVINCCGYATDSTYEEQRVANNLVYGKAAMGRHSGGPLDWGSYKRDVKPDILLDITNFNPVLEIKSDTGIPKGRSQGKDLFSCYRLHPDFKDDDFYWDFMPKHEHILDIYKALRSCNAEKAENFVQKVLLWKKI